MVEGRVIAVDGRVVIRADEHQVLEHVLATPGQPINVMAVAEAVAVTTARIEEADPATAVIELV